MILSASARRMPAFSGAARTGVERPTSAHAASSANPMTETASGSNERCGMDCFSLRIPREWDHGSLTRS